MTAWCWESRPAGCAVVAEWAREDDSGQTVAYVQSFADGTACYKVVRERARSVHARSVLLAFDRVAERLAEMGVRTAGPRVPDELLVPPLLGRW